MIDDYMVRQSNDPRIVVPQERAPKNAVTAASLNIVRDKERNKSEMITDKAYRNQEFGTLLHNEIFSMVCLKKWSADSISSDFLY